MAKVMKLVLVASDFPPGWKSTPDHQTRSAEDKAVNTELNTCVGTTGDEADKARWSGDNFESDQYRVTSEAVLVKDDASFRQDTEAIQGSKVQGCVKDVFTKVLTKQIGTAPTSVDVTSLDVPKHGEVTVGIRLTVNAGPAASGHTVYLDLVLMGKNRAESTETLVSAGQAMDPALENSLVHALGKRVDVA